MRTTGVKAIALILCGLMTLGSLSLPPRAAALDLSEEKDLGRQLLVAISEKLPLVKDGELVTYIQALGDRLTKVMGTTSYNYRFFIVDESVPNAFAIPGGYIFVFRGLIEIMASEGELASILCHELAHIQARHIHRRMEAARIANVATIAGVIAAALLGAMGGGGGAAPQALAVGGMAGAKSFELKYSRDNEQEADQLGLRYLCAAGYAPSDMASVMQKMAAGGWRSNSKIPSYLSTHPALGERVQYIKDLSRGMKCSRGGAGGAFDKEDFALMQAVLVADYSDQRTALERFSRDAEKGDVIGQFGLGRYYLRQGQVDEAVKPLQEAAKKKSGNPLVLTALGTAYFQQGKLADARRTLETSLLINPDDAVTHFRLATVLQDLEETREAFEHLMKIEEYAPVYPEIDYRLGVVLGKMNRLGEAHFHLGRYHERKHDLKLALFHYKKARALLSADYSRKDELDQTIERVEKRSKKEALESRKD